MAAKKLIITVGLPRSGKSTWSQAQGFPVVNPDSIRLALHGMAYIEEAEQFVWAITRTMIRSLFIAGHDTVILDATNTSKERREQWRSKMYVRQFVKFTDVPPKTCVQRAIETDKEFLIPVIERMSLGLEEPEADELDSGESIVWHNNHQHFKQPHFPQPPATPPKLATHPAARPFKGKRVVLTGAFKFETRETYEQKLRAAGAIVNATVHDKIDYVIAGEKAGSKLKKGQEKGICILGEISLREMLCKDPNTYYAGR